MHMRAARVSWDGRITSSQCSQS